MKKPKFNEIEVSCAREIHKKLFDRQNNTENYLHRIGGPAVIYPEEFYPNLKYKKYYWFEGKFCGMSIKTSHDFARWKKIKKLKNFH